ncbi:unnamed protein product [Orchesella dallaii]|uniref:Uncharacterized protein n=1 Tax=Orchesella dallaii TaxID=48710 RepID=A0ABP1R7X5_9HEXA
MPLLNELLISIDFHVPIYRFVICIPVSCFKRYGMCTMQWKYSKAICTICKHKTKLKAGSSASENGQIPNQITSTEHNTQAQSSHIGFSSVFLEFHFLPC